MGRGQHIQNVPAFGSLDEMWAAAVFQVLQRGERTPSRDGDCIELCGYDGVLANLDQTFLLNPVRAADPVYAAAETLWYLSGTDAVEMIKTYAPQYARFAEDDGRANGAYGYRWHYDAAFRIKRDMLKLYAEAGKLGVMPPQPPVADYWQSQLRMVVEVLRAKPDSRQAVITMWNAGDLPNALAGDKRDLPCTLSMQFLVRDRRLCCITTMRSNDLWLGMPYDVFAFTTIQRLVATALDLRPGWYKHQAGSVHIYSRNEEKAKQVQPHSPLARMSYPQWPTELDPWLHIETAIRFEHEWRTRPVGAAIKGMPSETFLSDLALLCASKFNADITPANLTAPMLAAALAQKRGWK